MFVNRRVQKAKHHFFQGVDIKDVLIPIPEADLRTGCATKVVVTIGPACQDVAMLKDLLEAGMTCARVDLTWGPPSFHETTLENLATAMGETNRLCCVWLDTTGREITVRRKVETTAEGWLQHQNPIAVESGSQVVLTAAPGVEASSGVLPVTYPGLGEVLRPGQNVFVGRYLSTGAEGGTLTLEVQSIAANGDVHCIARTGAALDGLLTVMVSHNAESPDAAFDLDIPIMTEHDAACIREFGRRFEVDYVSLSYTSTRRDVEECRAFLDALGMFQTKIIAKVERKPGVRNFDAIALAADGILFSRGNLGMDYEPELMALLQKRVIGRCNVLGKPVIVTRFVDTMVSTPRPTRAEATDVANAVLDGMDAVLLGAETLRGAYPLVTVQTVVRLCRAAEEQFDYRAHHELLVNERFDEESPLAGLGGSEYDLPGAYHPASSMGDVASITASTKWASTSAVTQRRGKQSSLSLATGISQGGGLPPLHPSSPTGATAPIDGRAWLRPGSDGPIEDGGGPIGELNVLAAAPHTVSAFGSLPPRVLADGSVRVGGFRGADAVTYLHKLEGMASNATRTAEKLCAGLIIVISASGRTASLVAKYRPPMPVMAVVVPTLKSNRLKWRLEGKYLARQCLILRGVHPILAEPMSSGSDDLLSDSIAMAVDEGLCKPLDYIVCITSERGALVLKVTQVDARGEGMRNVAEHYDPLAPERAKSSFTAAAFSPSRDHLDFGHGSPVATGSGTGSPFATGSGAGSPFASGTGGMASPFGDALASPNVGAPPSPYADHAPRTFQQRHRPERRVRNVHTGGFLGAMTDAHALQVFADELRAGGGGHRLPTMTEDAEE